MGMPSRPSRTPSRGKFAMLVGAFHLPSFPRIGSRRLWWQGYAGPPRGEGCAFFAQPQLASLVADTSRTRETQPTCGALGTAPQKQGAGHRQVLGMTIGNVSPQQL